MYIYSHLLPPKVRDRNIRWCSPCLSAGGPLVHPYRPQPAPSPGLGTGRNGAGARCLWLVVILVNVDDDDWRRGDE